MKTGKFERLYVLLGRKLGETLHEKMLNGTLVEQKFFWPKVIAYGISIIIYLFSIAFAYLGFYLVFTELNNISSDIIGFLFVIIAIFTFPYIKKRKYKSINRSDFPTLFNVIDRIAEEMNSKPINNIVISSDFNAAFTQRGMKKENTLIIGYPLFHILEPDEKIALIAHELAHGVNKDSSKGFIIGSAYSSLVKWYETITPDQLWDTRYRKSVIPMFFINIILYFFSLILYFISSILIHLLYREKQRAEYMADYYSAKVASSNAVIKLLDKLYLGYIFESCVQRVTIRSEKNTLFDLLRTEVSHANLDLVNKIKNEEKEKGSRLHFTHPPTMYRAEFIKKQDFNIPRVKITKQENTDLETELHVFNSKMEKELIDKYRSSLY